METLTKINDYSIECTFDHAQYWTGVGVAFTNFDEVFTGVGATPEDALEDAYNLVEESGYDTSELFAILPPPEDRETCECAEDDYAECEHSWFVSIFVK